ncbi:MAG TPA: M14-type cytosolic carboxypeptidase [Minicystis sp.]|nr:M14-type cytosolic carboxypeptidase [Minicystis sp.]
MRVDADLEGGAIEVVHDGADAIDVALRPDVRAPFMQWFAFHGRGARGRPTSIRFVNAGEATYADAWDGYRVAASYDGERWFRVPTSFDGAIMTARHTPERDLVTYAYFAPYSVARRERLLARAARSERARVEVLGQSVEGRPVPLVTVGDDDGDKRRVFIVARQHPGETPAEWFAEGAIERLLDPRDELAAALLDRAVVRIVPCANPDGGVLGNLRTNAAGTDLNRAWLEPSPDASPEVLAIRERMNETGVDLFLDVHADERNPYIFAAGCEGNPSYDERMDALEDLFMSSLTELDGDFQREYGYDRDAPGEGNLATAGNWAGEAFGCLSLTLEMPFKDNQNHPDPLRGWSPDRAKHFGRTTLESVFVCLDRLRS